MAWGEAQTRYMYYLQRNGLGGEDEWLSGSDVCHPGSGAVHSWPMYLKGVFSDKPSDDGAPIPGRQFQ